MRVRLIAEISDRVRKYAIGDLCDLPDEQAARWIRQGLAIGVTTAETSGAPLEAAALDKPEHTAVLPHPRRRG